MGSPAKQNLFEDKYKGAKPKKNTVYTNYHLNTGQMIKVICQTKMWYQN